MDLRRADLGLLVSLDALLAERSVTGAARRLGISQPALSAQLARLRDLMGDEILVGNAHGMVPTPRAEKLRAPLNALLRDMAALISAETGFEPATSDRHFHIAAVDLSLVTILPPLVRLLRDAAPGLRITTGALDHDRMHAEAEAGRIDLVITSGQQMSEGFDAVRLLETDHCAIWRRGHPILRDGPITLAQFGDASHLRVSPVESARIGPLERALQAQGLRRHVAMAISSYLLAPALLRASDLVGLVPRILLDFDGAGLIAAPPPFAFPPLVAKLGWHPRNRNDAGHRWLRETILSIVRNR